jgi:hypothetical protein
MTKEPIETGPVRKGQLGYYVIYGIGVIDSLLMAGLLTMFLIVGYLSGPAQPKDYDALLVGIVLFLGAAVFSYFLAKAIRR